LKKRKEHVKEIEDIRMREFWELIIFIYNTKVSSFGKLKTCMGGGF